VSNTDLVPSKIQHRDQGPRIALLSVRFDTAPCAHPDSFAQNQFGKGVDVDSFVIVGKVLAQQPLDSNSAVSPAWLALACMASSAGLLQQTRDVMGTRAVHLLIDIRVQVVKIEIHINHTLSLARNTRRKLSGNARHRWSPTLSPNLRPPSALIYA